MLLFLATIWLESATKQIVYQAVLAKKMAKWPKVV
jgi:hypothetical protein